MKLWERQDGSHQVTLAAHSEKVVAHVGLHLFQTCFRKYPQQIWPCRGLFGDLHVTNANDSFMIQLTLQEHCSLL